MSSSASDGSFPGDIVVEILKRLPVRSLLRCRCVCKSWRDTIDGARFVALHQEHSALHASNWHIACVEWYNPPRNPPRSLCCLTLSITKVEIPFAAPTSRYALVGSCNGLLPL
ncbi:hypothetical protein EUGRSUZ_I00139 [Eucalyptus grandis]|uniref:Uncharacterized protein n=2 Tax=Eucalyptus grandis TaxID=71139 RepID=A0ACC3JB64_EUCGR|nr:hypothetical protein EUGRSUZ_I00139 [Eucalyptus grandis]